jgi:hypothetical protein
VDRLLSNPMINVDDILVRWEPYIVGARDAIVVALDWTDFDADKQATIMLSLITDHGRATPLVWLTVNRTRLRTTAASTSIACWCGWLNCCLPTSRCALLPTAASGTKNSTGC